MNEEKSSAAAALAMILGTILAVVMGIGIIGAGLLAQHPQLYGIVAAGN